MMISGFETNFVEALPLLCSGVLLDDAAAFFSVPNDIILYRGRIYIAMAFFDRE